MNESSLQHVHIRVERSGMLYVKTGPAFGIQIQVVPDWVELLVRRGVINEETADTKGAAENIAALLRQLGHTVTIEVRT